MKTWYEDFKYDPNKSGEPHLMGIMNLLWEMYPHKEKVTNKYRVLYPIEWGYENGLLTVNEFWDIKQWLASWELA